MENEEWVTGNIRVLLGGVMLDLQMTVPAKPVKAQRMLPVFQQMTDSFVSVSENAVESWGAKVSCSKGCAACCRQLIPVGEIEAYEIAEMVEALPEPRRSQIKMRFEQACRHLLENGWLGRLDKCAELTEKGRENLVLEYFYEGITCPFLENEMCSIHAARPLACREYLVTSPAVYCSDIASENIKGVGLVAKPSQTVREITNDKNSSAAINFVPLILALGWAKRNVADAPEKTGEQWMADFFTNLTKSKIPQVN